MMITFGLEIHIEKNIIECFVSKYISMTKTSDTLRTYDFCGHCSDCSHFAASVLQWSLVTKYRGEDDPYD